MRLFFIIRPFVLLLCTTAASAQIDSGIVVVHQKPQVDSILYSCPLDTVFVKAMVPAQGLMYSAVAISPGSLPLPPPNETGMFLVPGATELSVMISRQSCHSDVFSQSLSCNPLALHIIDFNVARAGPRRALLSWRTADEQNTDHYLVEKSADGGSFHSVAVLKTGNLPGTNSYQWTDDNLYAGKNYYRIRQVDHDGKEYLTETRVLDQNNAGESPVQLYPNPTSGLLNLALFSDGDDELSIRLVDLKGRELWPAASFPVAAGRNVFSLKLGADLVDGIYLLHYALKRTGRSGNLRFLKEAGR